jgi:uncharacterized repeat protein (TIGR03803 family)
MQRNLLRSIPTTLACIVTLTLIGCGGGSNSSGGEATYGLSGKLTGPDAGQSVSLEDNGGDKLTLSANGAFSFPMRLAAGATYVVKVQSHTPGIACSVSNGSGTVGSSDVTGIGVSCSAGTGRVLYSFGANATDGQEPYAGVITDGAGNVYGTTQTGGVNGRGTVFKISAAGTETILHSFGASANDGLTPRAGVIMDNAGNLYGTTLNGGANRVGSVFKIDTARTETILYSFGGRLDDGWSPSGSLIMDSAGNLYGETVYGGANTAGTVFKIDTAGTETILYSFAASANDGQLPGPYSAPIMDNSGSLYGTTANGGTNRMISSLGDGTAFKISSTGTETILYSFGLSTSDGLAPYAGLTVDSAGNLYGTTMNGGPNFGKIVNGFLDNGGTVFVID